MKHKRRKEKNNKYYQSLWSSLINQKYLLFLLIENKPLFSLHALDKKNRGLRNMK